MRTLGIVVGIMLSLGINANDTLFFSGFEKGTIEEWASTLENGQSVFERNEISRLNGDFGFQILFTGSTQKGNFNTPNTIRWQEGETYRISFWSKGIEASDNATTNIKLFANDGTKIGQLNLSNWNNESWTKYTTDFTPEISDSLGGHILFSFRPNSTGQGEYYLDDFIIEKVVYEQNFWTSLKTEKVKSDSTIKWLQFGPGMSGNNKSAYWHPYDPNCLYIGPNMGNSYVSFDKGISYQSMFDEDESSYKIGQRGPTDFFSIDFSKQNPNFGFCSDERNNGIYRTYDRGASWKNINAPEFDGKYVACVAVDPQDDKTWYAGGGQMRNLGNNLFPMAEERGTMVHGASLKKLWKSTDSGDSWVLKNNGLHEETQFETILVDPKNSNTIYATTNHGFYKSIDGAETWIKKTDGFDYDMMRSMTHHFDKENDVLTLFVICNPMWKSTGSTITDDKGGIFKSVDRGETWIRLQGNLALDMRQFQGNYDIKKSYYHCAAYVFGMSDEEFKTQYPDLPSKITIRFNTIAVDPNDVNNIYLNNEYSNASRNNFKPGQVWRSKDGGHNWHVCFRNGKAWKAGSEDYNYWVNRGNPMETNISLSYLEEWIDRDMYDRKGCNFVRWNADGTVLHTQMAKISLMSYDKGVTWIDIDDAYTSSGAIVGAGNSNVPGHGFYQHTSIKSKVFCAAGENQLCITAPDGNDVRQGAQAVYSKRILDDEASLSCYAIHPHDTLKHYALFFRQAKKGKLMMSEDNGQTWFEQGTAVPHWDIQAHSGDQSVHQLNLMFDEENPNNMYFCVPRSSRDIEYVGNSVTAFGVHKSSNGGITWKEVNTGLPESKDVTAICFHPDDFSILYATVQKSGGGLFQSNDYGETWDEVESTKNISGDYGINDIHFSRDGSAYITAGWKNGNRDDGGVWMSDDGLNNWSRIFDYPWTFRIETAMYDPHTILVSTLPNTKIGSINAGTYLSKDGGESWQKINSGNGQSDRINDIAIDNHIPGRYYASTYGSGWYVANDTKHGIITRVKDYSYELAELDIKVFPNPASSNITIVSEEKSLAESIVSLYNLSGQIVLSQKGGNERMIQMNINHLVSGLYLLDVVFADTRIQKKIIKQQ